MRSAFALESAWLAPAEPAFTRLLDRIPMNRLSRELVAMFATATLSMLLPVAHGGAQGADVLRAKIAGYTSAHDVVIVRELTDFLAIPNLASDTGNIRRNAEHLMRMLSSRGIAARLLESPTRRTAGRVWRARDSRRDEDGRVLCALRRTARRHRAMGDSAVEAGAPRQAARRGRTESSRFRRRPDRSTANGGSTAARRATTRRRSSPCSPRSTRFARRERRRR